MGNKELSVTRVKLESKENIPYQIKLNELISLLLTRIRIGEFINPAGEIKPLQADLVNLKYQIVSSERKEFINARAKFGFENQSNHRLRPDAAGFVGQPPAEWPQPVEAGTGVPRTSRLKASSRTNCVSNILTPWCARVV